MTNPTILLIHGSWHRAHHMGDLKASLESHSFRCTAIDLPSTQSPDLPPATLSDDCAAIRKAVEEEFHLNNNVFIVAHSYGGVPTNNALQGYSTAACTATGHTTSVTGIAFISSCPIPAGAAFWETLGGQPHAIHDFRTPEFLWIGAPGPEFYLYNLMDPARAKAFAASLLPQSFAAYTERTTYAAWKEIPCFYLRCARDQAMVPPLQQMAIDAARKDGAVWFEEETIEADHTPFVGEMLPKTTDFIIRAVQNGSLRNEVE